MPKPKIFKKRKFFVEQVLVKLPSFFYVFDKLFIIRLSSNRINCFDINDKLLLSMLKIKFDLFLTDSVLFKVYLAF